MMQTQLQIMGTRIIQIDVKKIDHQLLVNTTKKCYFPILVYISTKIFEKTISSRAVHK
jgi:hypothetical protein